MGLTLSTPGLVLSAFVCVSVSTPKGLKMSLESRIVSSLQRYLKGINIVGGLVTYKQAAPVLNLHTLISTIEHC